MGIRIAVLGSNAFSGASLIALALERGMEVLGISRSPETDPVFLPYRWRPDGGESFRFHQLDLNRDLDDIMEVITDFSPQYVINFASQSMVGESWQHPGDWMMTNVVSTVRLHDGLRRCPFLEKYVHISTPEVYGSCRGAVSEDQAFNPSTPYAVSRAAGDMSLKTFLDHYRFPVVFTRAANVYGPGQQLYRIIPRTIMAVRTGGRLPLHGGGHSQRSFIHIRDVAEGTLRVMERARPGEVYHLATERMIAIRDLVALICRRLGADFEEVAEITEDRPGKDPFYTLDCSRARKRLGWEDTISLEEGVDETAAWIDDNLEKLKGKPLHYTHTP